MLVDKVDKDKKKMIRLKSEFKLRTGADMKPATAGLESKEPSSLIFTFFLIGINMLYCFDHNTLDHLMTIQYNLTT